MMNKIQHQKSDPSYNNNNSNSDQNQQLQKPSPKNNNANLPKPLQPNLLFQRQPSLQNNIIIAPALNKKKEDPSIEAK